MTAQVTPPDTEPRAQAALLARRLLPAARAALSAVGTDPADRAPVLAALDIFLTAPAPSTFLSALRCLEQARRQVVLQGRAAATMRRGFEHGLAALRAVPSLPPALVQGLGEYLPRDVRAGRRLTALAALAGAYHELGARVAADADHRRRRWTGLPRRRPRR